MRASAQAGSSDLHPPTPPRSRGEAELRGRAWRDRWLGVPFFALCALGVFLNLEEWPPPAGRTPAQRAGGMALRFAIGLVFAFCAVFIYRGGRFHRRLRFLLVRTTALPMRLSVASKERPLLIGLHPLSDPALRDPQFRFAAALPTWGDVGEVVGETVKVHLDPEPFGPIVVETSRGLLHSLDGHGREERVEGRLQPRPV